MLPLALRSSINFAGTIGNGGKQYFATDVYANKYYSYEATVSKGGVVHAPVTDGTPISGDQTTLEKIVKEDFGGWHWPIRSHTRTPLLARDQAQADGSKLKIAPAVQRQIRQKDGSHKPFTFVDWDASSGLMCGNTWGTCSGMAEIYMNIFSPTADNPLMPAEVHKDYVEAFLDYNGVNWSELYNNKLQAPYCLGGQAWSQGYTYNCGSMGPDWFYIMNVNPGPYYSKKGWGAIPCYGHFGDTYGYCSCHVYFPGGEMKAYPPLVSDTWAYPSKTAANEWSLTFEFTGGLEFTMSCTQNSCLSVSQGPIQHFIYEVIKDPFLWGCNVLVANRQDCPCGASDCGDQTKCMSNPDCCYDEKVDPTKYPWCYKRTLGCNVLAANRQDCPCGTDDCGVSTECAKHPNCCYDNSVDPIHPWCYKKG
jgi:hypothetical protein